MKILITGGCGYVGSNLVRFLKENLKAEIVVVDWNSKDQVKGVKYFDYDFVETPVSKLVDIDLVIHLAAFISVPEGEKEPRRYYENNVTKSIKFIDKCMSAGISKFIFASSAAVYGNLEWCQEDMDVKPTNVYGVTKKIIEDYLITMSKFGLNSIILRSFNIIGATSLGRKYTSDIVTSMCRCYENRASFKIFGSDFNTKDGTGERDYIDIYDVCDAYFCSIEKMRRFSGCQIYNVCSNNPVSVKDLCSIFSRVHADFEVEEYPRRDGDVAKCIGDNSKLKGSMDWRPIIKIEESVMNQSHYYFEDKYGKN